MQKMKLQVTKTARIHQVGTIGKHIKKVWIVLHGYGMLTEYFIKKFETLDDGETLVLAPEGLSRFYLSGTYGRVGSSWMTKDEREDDIADNMQYLDQLYETIHSQVAEGTELTVLGFSQGSPTACRWLMHRRPGNSRLKVWASDIPSDVLIPENKEYLNALDIQLFVGDNDKYIDEERVEKFTALIDAQEVKYTLTRYEGEHKIYPEVLNVNR